MYKYNQNYELKKTCELTPLKRSQEILTVILNDIPTHYTHVGAGITGIKLSATNVYVISIAQEERIDQLTYEVAVDENCEIKILSRELNAISPWDNN